MKLVFATNNKNKILEVQQLLTDSIEIISLENIGCFEEIPETGNTIEENYLRNVRKKLLKKTFDKKKIKKKNF